MMRAVTAAALLLVCRCGGDAPANPIRVAVPADDDSPPEAVIIMRRLDGARLGRHSQPPGPGHPRPITLTEPRLRATTVGRDPNGGVARVRVSISERIDCRHAGGGTEEVLRTRYFPPPQIETIRSNPGAPLPTAATRTVPLSLVGDRCGGAEATAVHGELWGEAINGAGLEAVTPHLRFSWRKPTFGGD
jgi:hypothetical protein